MDIMKEVQGDKFKIERFEVAYLENKKEGVHRLEGKNIEGFKWSYINLDKMKIMKK